MSDYKTNENMRFLLILCCCASLLSCQVDNTSDTDGETGTPSGDSLDRQPQNPPAESMQWLEYSNQNYYFQTRWPESWRIAATNPRASLTAINLYSPQMETEFELPLNFHTQASVTHLSAYPEGWGTSLPSGDRRAIADFEGSTPVAFALDRKKSYVLLLENGQVWGYLLHPAQTPEGWKEEGYIFAQIAVDEFEAQCFDGESGEPISMKDCDPMTGDRIKRRGQVRQKDQRIIRTALAEWVFTAPERAKPPLSDLIEIQQPMPNESIRSPLTIQGKARGQWFFEGDFPVQLQDKDYNTIATGIAEADGQWMTSNFVPFELEMSFEDAPDDERGYLVFQKANASGKPALDRSYRLPVLFPQK